MDVSAAVQQRRSVRRFKPDPVPRETLEEILQAARWAPSWGNTQSWQFYVLTGDVLERFKAANRKSRLQDEPTHPDIAMPEFWPDNLKRRYVDVGKQVLSSQGIAREDRAGRQRYYGEMFSLFGAPCLIVTCVPRDCVPAYAMLDVGLVNQTLCLLAHEKGLGTIMLAAAVRYPSLIRQWVPIPQDRLIAIGTALGYPDWEAPVNRFRRKRASLEELVTWQE